MRFLARPFDERGLAMPLALITLLILSVIVVGFSTLSATEPTIAGNQLATTQARALAEAGVERAIWALQHPADPNGIPSPLDRRAPAPFDGSRTMAVSARGSDVGGLRVTVSTGVGACSTQAERCIVSSGWAPDAGFRQAHRQVSATVRNPQLLFKDPPAAVSARGDLHVGANAVIDARADASCGKKVGTLTAGVTSVDGSNAEVRGGADGNSVPNEVTDARQGPVPADAHDVVTNLAVSSFDGFAFTDTDVNFLRAYAKSQGTYLQGAVTFDRIRKMPNGLVFVDTVSGTNISAEGISPATPASDFADVAVHGNSPSAPDAVFSGWLFVNGSLTIDGDVRIRGLVYAQNEISYHRSGTGGIEGALVSRNIRRVPPTIIDSDIAGTAVVTYDCAHARTGGRTIPNSWSITPGTYRELCDSCS